VSDFRDAIARQVSLMTCTCGVCMPIVDDYASATAVLAMPEMVAIRESLRYDYHDWCCAECRDAEWVLAEFPAVIAWVLGDDDE